MSTLPHKTVYVGLPPHKMSAGKSQGPECLTQGRIRMHLPDVPAVVLEVGARIAVQHRRQPAELSDLGRDRLYIMPLAQIQRRPRGQQFILGAGLWLQLGFLPVLTNPTQQLEVTQ